MAEPFDQAYCPLCDVVLTYGQILEHSRYVHPHLWLTLTWSAPLEFQAQQPQTIADQLDVAAPDL